MSHPNVIVDERESDWVLNGLKSYDKVRAEKKMIPVGDIVINGNTCIERKEINNLISDITSEKSTKPWSQVKDMKENFDTNYLIVHGTREDIDTYRVPENRREEYLDKRMKMINGVGVSVQASWGVNYLRVEDIMLFLDLLYSLFEREMGMKRSYRPYSATKSSATLRERLIAMLCHIQGIGPSRAKKLVNKKKSLKAISRMNRYELRDIMGEKIGSNVYNVFNEAVQ